MFAQNPVLIDNNYNSFVQSVDNELWLSSQGGWNRYNGNETFHYRSNDSISGLKGEWIQSFLYPDKDGNLWTSTYEYLCSYSHDQNKFYCFQPSNTRDTFRSDIKVIDYDIESNELLIRAENKLHIYNISSGRSKVILHNETTEGQNFHVYNQGNQQKIIASTWTSTLEIYSRNNGNWTKSDIDFSQCPVYSQVSISNAIAINNSIWLCSNIGLLQLDKINPCNSKLHKFKGKEFISTYSLEFDDHLLITTSNHGLLAFNLNEMAFTAQFQIDDKQLPILSNRPVEIFDSGRDILLSHRNQGVQSIPKSLLRANLSLKDNPEFKSKKIVVDDNIVALSDRFNHLSILKDGRLVTNQNLDLDGILNSLLIDNKSVYYADDYSIWQYDLLSEKSKLLHSDKNYTINKMSSFDNVLSVIVDSKSYELIDAALVLNKKIRSNAEIVMHEKLDHNLEVVAKNNFVEIYQKEKMHTIETGSYIYSINYDSTKNEISLGLGKGLGLIDLRSYEFKIIDILGARVGKIENIGKGKKIINTSKGLFYIEEDEVYRRINDGQEALNFAMSKDYIYFIDKNGLNTIPIEELVLKEKPSIYVKSATYEQSGSERNIKFNYSYQDMPLSLDILSTNWKANQLGYFTYQIDGIHNQPIQQEFSESIDLPGLVEGNYEIEIYGYSHDLTKSAPLSISIAISGPFWRQWWFFLISIIGVFLAAYLYFKYKNKKLQEQHEIQRNISDLEKSALQAQMNPHFIFNCLNSIQGFIMDNDKEQAMEYLGGFAQLIRSNLNASTSSKISLAEEHRILHNYLKLERLRLNKSFEYEITLPSHKDPHDIMIPPMLIQPFVENAVIHGMRNGIKNGKIEIEFNLNGSTLNVEVSDNGDSSLPPINISGHKSVGVDITRKRLNYINQSDQNIDSLSINHTSSGTTVNLSIQLD